jgi:hypothetical protein
MIIDRKTTYLAYITNSVSSLTFKNVYFRDNDTIIDITENGKYSCAIFVTSILYLLDMIDRPHATVRTTIDRLVDNNWEEVNSPQPGDILLWEKLHNHEHVGFYMSEKVAISTSGVNNSKVLKLNPTYNGKRKIYKIFRYTNF